MNPPFLTSKILTDVRHGFFGREGGISSEPFATNNMSIAIGDDPETVHQNRMEAARQLGHYRPHMVLFKQTHSTRVVSLIDKPDPAVLVEADAMVTARPELLLGILTADCSPVLLADPVAKVVGAAHAGWKGAAGGIVAKTVEAMVSLGAAPANIRAVIGPTISGANYEIGPETAAEIVTLDPAAARYVAIPHGGAREHFDIPGLITEQLFDAGVGLVSDLGVCTYADPVRYFSHRYATHHGTRAGRQIALIGL